MAGDDDVFGRHAFLSNTASVLLATPAVSQATDRTEGIDIDMLNLQIRDTAQTEQLEPEVLRVLQRDPLLQRAYAAVRAAMIACCTTCEIRGEPPPTLQQIGSAATIALKDHRCNTGTVAWKTADNDTKQLRAWLVEYRLQNVFVHIEIVALRTGDYKLQVLACQRDLALEEKNIRPAT